MILLTKFLFSAMLILCAAGNQPAVARQVDEFLKLDSDLPNYAAPDYLYGEDYPEIIAAGYIYKANDASVYDSLDFGSLNGATNESASPAIAPLKESGSSCEEIDASNPNPVDTGKVSVPEPATMLLLGVGLVGLFGAARKAETYSDTIGVDIPCSMKKDFLKKKQGKHPIEALPLSSVFRKSNSKSD